jgi:hypothetical protein
MTHLERLGDRDAGDDTAPVELSPLDGDRREDGGTRP